MEWQYETEITNLNKKLMNLGDQLEKIYADLRTVNESLEDKDYIVAIKLLCDILEGE